MWVHLLIKIVRHIPNGSKLCKAITSYSLTYDEIVLNLPRTLVWHRSQILVRHHVEDDPCSKHV